MNAAAPTPPGFFDALAFALRWETGGDQTGGYNKGGYTNDPNDPGGETKFGISKLSYPELDIAALTLEQASTIYLNDYWLASGNQESHCSQLPPPLAAVHFDCVVNIGNRKIARDGTVVMHRRANMILQRALGVDDDGYFGPRSQLAVSDADPDEVARRALTQRDLYYATLGRWANKYRAGWLARTNSLRRHLALGPHPSILPE